MQTQPLSLHSLSSAKSSTKKAPRPLNTTQKSLSQKSANKPTKPNLLLEESTERGLFVDNQTDKTVYETAGIVDRLDKLKAKVESELTKVCLFISLISHLSHLSSL
jgi:hypothetical protein